jgi:hypothetical protein
MALVTSARRLRRKNTGPADALPAAELHFGSNGNGHFFWWGGQRRAPVPPLP